jgi:hypothetical protein
MDALAGFLVAIGFVFVAVVVGLRMILPRGIWADFFSNLLHTAVMAVWHAVFGAPKVRVVRARRRRRGRV